MINFSRLKQYILLICLLLISIIGHAQEKSDMSLWYTQPAKVWNEALPVGNGRLGAMIFGNPAKEVLQLNEETFWSGGPSRNDNPDALTALTEVRSLIFDGEFKKAEDLINQNFTAKQLHGSMYQTIGEFTLNFPGHEQFTDYYRELDIEQAISLVTYKADGITYTREVFASFPDELIVVRLTASEPGQLTFTADFNGALQKNKKTLDANTLEMTGISSTHEGVEGQVKFNARAQIFNTGGTALADSGKIRIENANEVTIHLSVATNFKDYKSLTENESEKCKSYLQAAEKKAYPDMREDHIAAYQNYFNRVSLNLGTSAAAEKPTDERIRNFSTTYDPALVSLYFQFGRYLLISSSQPGGQPANLQGIWNDQVRPAWDSKYTININTEMNYWPAEKCNLPEMHEPLIQMVKELSETGKQTASDMYGCGGWVAHHNTDIWRITGVVDGAYWGMWPMGGAWLTMHLWDKYLYNGDLEYLRSVYPVMQSACAFYQGFLIPEPTHGWLVVSPSISPENSLPGQPSVTAGTTMDNQLLFDLFTKTSKAAKLLGIDKSEIQEYQAVLDGLAPMQIGQYGQLQEWMQDLDRPEDKHRHVSHLYGLFPSNQISPGTSPELFDAARTSLVHRGDVSTGWSMGWKVNFWARLLDGNHAMKLIKDQLTLVDPVNGGFSGGTYPNFFDAHPPFQIDGNFGCAAGIAEMLIQYHDGAIHLLPALPDEWEKGGSIKGIRTYGGYEVSFSWKDGKVDELTIKSNLGGNCRIRVPNPMQNASGKALKEAKGLNQNPFFEVPEIKDPIISEKASLNVLEFPAQYMYDIPTKPGQTYRIKLTK